MDIPRVRLEIGMGLIRSFESSSSSAVTETYHELRLLRDVIHNWLTVSLERSFSRSIEELEGTLKRKRMTDMKESVRDGGRKREEKKKREEEGE